MTSLTLRVISIILLILIGVNAIANSYDALWYCIVMLIASLALDVRRAINKRKT